jgi:putative ABC transport system permease protein
VAENELTLTQLAASLQASPHHVSQVINEVLGKTFYDYINESRVCEVQRCLRDPAYDGQPILDIALASGFNSKAAFYKAFKQQVGVTPSEYRQRQSVAEPSNALQSTHGNSVFGRPCGSPGPIRNRA